jgi:NADH-quinone oxidoreductase subunit J
MGAEFLAMILVIVYVGAVAVLFLFVVMMLDVNFVELRRGAIRYLPIGGAVGLVLLIELIVVFSGWVMAPAELRMASVPIPSAAEVTNTHALGQVLYTDYVYLFQVAGLILLVAMIGAIVLTLRSREGVRRQSIARQVGRTRAESIEVRRVPTREGI